MSNLPVTEELDFSYALGLMRPLHDVEEFSLLPELFTILGHDKLIDLCRYCGGETLTIPTVQQLLNCVESLQIFYSVYIKQDKSVDDIPITLEPLVAKICEVYNAGSDISKA